mmetsp:Transcript_29168/g.61675  ORF Transcript_29168/g.61675 Transcript_29168/m.61675 type:complete len:218 (+) Transcript_29168:1940-2593(+)
MWQRERCWYAVAFDMMTSCAPASVLSNSTCIFTCKMYHAAMAYLWDHVISGQALLPGSAFMELGHSTIACALHGSTGANGGYAMCDSVIALPLSLDALGGEMSDGLYCTAELQLSQHDEDGETTSPLQSGGFGFLASFTCPEDHDRLASCLGSRCCEAIDFYRTRHEQCGASPAPNVQSCSHWKSGCVESELCSCVGPVPLFLGCDGRYRCSWIADR